MPIEDAPPKHKSNLKLWLAIVAATGSAVAIIPPAITALRASPAVSQSGSGNSVILGSTVGSNNQTINNYSAMWMEGIRTIAGATQAPRTAAPLAVQAPAISPIPTAEPKDPEPGAVGRLVTNASLLNEATWSPDQSKVTRLLTFHMHVEATGSDEKPGSVDVTLFRDGKDVCTISLNNKTSSLMQGGARWDNSTCHETLTANAVVTYKTRVKTLEMNPLVIRLDFVDAIRK